MKYLIYSMVMFLSLSAFAQLSPASGDDSNSEIVVNGNDSFDVVVSDQHNLTDLSDFQGPYSFSSLPREVREKIIRGVDDNGNDTVSAMLRQRSAEQEHSHEGSAPSAFNLDNAPSTGASVVNFVRRFRGQGDGVSVRLRNNTLQRLDGTKVKDRQFWIYYKAKFN